MFLSIGHGDEDLVLGARNHIESAIISFVLESSVPGG